MLILYRAILIVALLFLLTGFSGDKTAWGPYYPRTWTVENISGEIGSEHTQILGITLIRDSLRDIVEKFGQMDVFKIEPGPCADHMVCYVSQDDSDDTVIIFICWTKTINYFIVTTKDYIPFCDKCAKSALVKKGIATKGGITLGITKNRFMAIFGKPTEIIGGDGVAYRYIRTFRFTDEELKRYKMNLEKSEYPPYDVDIMSGIQAHFLEGKLVWFMVYETWG